jgi:1-aminocyclopropane-1-carboxylate deaminase
MYHEAPLQELFLPDFMEHEVRVQILRGDLVHPICSGNKLWKLKYNLLEAIRAGKERLVTFGGAYSNHLLGVACAAAALGFRSLGIVRGDEPFNNVMLEQCRWFGMDLHQVSRSEYRDKKELIRRLDLDGAQNYVLPEGGSNRLALEGCAEAVPAGSVFDYIFVAAGTGGTLAGLAMGEARKNSRARLEGIAVLKGAGYLEEEVEALVPGLKNWTVHHDYHLGGYARSIPDYAKFLRQFPAATGICLDPVYTGKVFYALRELIRKQYFPPGAAILVIHTGGLWGWSGFQADLKPE